MDTRNHGACSVVSGRVKGSFCMDEEPIKKRLHRYYDLIAGGVCLIRQTAEEQILFVNEEMLRIYQCATEDEFFQLTKGRFAGLMEAEDYVPLEARTNSRHGDLDEGYSFLTFRCYTKTGSYRHLEGTFHKVNIPELGKVWMMSLVNKERNLAVSNLDPVTGLLNMHAFYQRVQKKADALRKAVKPGDLEVRYCPVYLNLTNFKVYNEMHGIYEGDRMLRKIGQLLKGAFPASYITRLSGDNFALFVPRDNLEAKLKEVCQAVNNEVRTPNIAMKAGIGSIETAVSVHRRPITTYFDQAKLASDSIKKDATRSIAFYNESMRQSIADRIFILDNLDRAIQKGHIRVYYQPVMRAMTSKLCGCEALARWIDPTKGLLPPDSFIPVLEESRLISRLDCYVIEEVAKLLRYQIDNHFPMVPISVNLSRYDFLLMDPLAFVERIVEQYHIPRYYLRIEVTESALVKNRHLLIEKLHQFHQSGYQVWLDDFGSAYSSLNVLQNYEFDELKIDQGLLRYFNEDSRKIIRSIVLMAKRWVSTCWQRVLRQKNTLTSCVPSAVRRFRAITTAVRCRTSSCASNSRRQAGKSRPCQRSRPSMQQGSSTSLPMPRSPSSSTARTALSSSARMRLTRMPSPRPAPAAFRNSMRTCSSKAIRCVRSSWPSSRPRCTAAASGA